MITDTYLRKIVEESGRREITLSMVTEAQKQRIEAERFDPLYIYPELIYWRCPSCYRVLSSHRINSCTPDLYCRCQMPKFMVVMQPWPDQNKMEITDEAD